jgi:hypothetical protein
MTDKANESAIRDTDRDIEAAWLVTLDRETLTRAAQMLEAVADEIREAHVKGDDKDCWGDEHEAKADCENHEEIAKRLTDMRAAAPAEANGASAIQALIDKYRGPALLPEEIAAGGHDWGNGYIDGLKAALKAVAATNAPPPEGGDTK